MKTELTQQQILLYQQNGFLLVEDFLNKEELEFGMEKNIRKISKSLLIFYL